MAELPRRLVLGGTAALTAIGTLRRARAYAGTPLRIGVLNDPNGPFADNGGIGCVYAARLAAEEFGNSVLGRPIEIIAADNQNKPDIAAAISREWIDTQGVEAIVDGASSGAGLAIQEVTREKRKLFLIVGPATTELTGRYCSPFGFHFAYDTYALAKGTASAVVADGGTEWFFITPDYTFGTAMERDASRFVRAAGGKVLGSVRHPLGTADYSSYLLQAQSSGATVVALANAGADMENCLKQAAEFGIGRGNQRVAALVTFITDVLAVGLPAAKGLNLTTSFYWDLNDATRAWTRRFRALKNRPPTMLQAGAYSSVRHYLEAVKAVGSTDSVAVADKMRAMPVNDMYNNNVTIRPDGRVLHMMYLMRVKSPEESRYKDDVYTIVARTPGAQAFRPMSEGGCPLVTG